MNVSEFDRAMSRFYLEFAFGGEDAEARARTYQSHFRTLSDLPAEAVVAAVDDILATWTDEKRTPRIGLVRAKAQDWLLAKLRGGPPSKLAVSECCRWCHAVAGRRKGSESKRLVIQHEPTCRFHDPEVEVELVEGVDQ